VANSHDFSRSLYHGLCAVAPFWFRAAGAPLIWGRLELVSAVFAVDRVSGVLCLAADTEAGREGLGIVKVLLAPMYRLNLSPRSHLNRET